MSARKAKRRPKALHPGEVRLAPGVASRARAIGLAQKVFDEEFGGEIRFMRAALMTAILALHDKGVHRHLATSLRMHVYNPLMRIEKRVTGGGEEMP